jgi:hypothetical protein
MQQLRSITQFAQKKIKDGVDTKELAESPA